MIYGRYLERCVKAGALRPLDYLFAERMAALEGSPDLADANLRDAWFAAAVMASRAIGEGSSCLILERIDEIWPQLPDDDESVAPPPPQLLRTVLAASTLCGSAIGNTPLVLEGDRLYLLRYARYEAETATRLLALAQAPLLPVPAGLLRRGDPASLWPDQDEAPNWQAVACAVAAARRLAVISGGPGTGKTYTMVRLLLTLLYQAREAARSDFRLALAAPTGKAAQRMAEAVRDALAAAPGSPVAQVLADPWIGERLPRDAATIHRLLGASSGQGTFRHDEANPLPVDAVIVDEASMVDLPLIARLLRALRPEARLVLIGDRYQLAAIEAGDVFGDLYGGGGAGAFSPALADEIEAATGDGVPRADSPRGLSDCVVTLQRGFRANRAIAELADAVNRGDAEGVSRLLGEAGPATGLWQPPDGRAVAARVAERVPEWFGPLRDADSPEAALAALAGFRVLTAVNAGPYGVDQVNRRIELALSEQLGLRMLEPYYHLRPILITRNDYRLRLFNGDIGIVFDAGQGPRVYFAVPQRDERGNTVAGSELMSVLPTGLPEHRTCYAMTVHKSQGSEFDRLVLILPEHDLPVVTRDLVYTGITRARDAVEIWASPGVLAEAVANRPTRRMSGVARRIDAGPGS